MDARTLDEPSSEEMNTLLLRLCRGVNNQAFRLIGNRVVTGPFSGMIIPPNAPWDDGNAGTKLLGCYEHELHEAIEHAIWRQPELVINVGCAEGYYAIGLARLLPKAAVIALDISTESRFMCADFAKQNKVDIAVVEGAHKPEEIAFSARKGHRLYVIDCEGAETTLVDLKKCPELVQSDIIVECHDFMQPNASLIVADRLAATHRVELIRPRLPDLEQFQFLKKTPAVMTALMMLEKRPMPCYWLTCWANTRGATNG